MSRATWRRCYDGSTRHDTTLEGEAQHAVATAEEVAAARTETLLPAARELLKKLTANYAPGVIKHLVEAYGADGKRTAAGNAALSQYTEAELRLLAAMRHIEQHGDLPPADGEQQGDMA